MKSWLTWSAPCVLDIVLWLSRCKLFVSRLERTDVLSIRTAFERGLHAFRCVIDGHGQHLIAGDFIRKLADSRERSLFAYPSLPLNMDTASCLASQLIIFNQGQDLLQCKMCLTWAAWEGSLENKVVQHTICIDFQQLFSGLAKACTLLNSKGLWKTQQ